jgi:alanyl-tRNA synthetase
MLKERGDLAKEVAALKRELARYRGAELLRDAREVSGARLVTHHMAEAAPQDIRDLAAAITEKPKTVAMLASGGERVHMVFSRSSDLEIDMRKAMQAACSLVGGKGGGKPEVCQGGGKSPEKVAEALAEAEKTVSEMLSLTPPSDGH